MSPTFRLAVAIAPVRRFEPLARLLASLRKLDRRGLPAVSLLFSLETGAPADVGALIEDFAWPGGEKRIVQHPQEGPVLRHLLEAGDLTDRHDAVAVLEEDLLLSPAAPEWIVNAVAAAEGDPAVAGISLGTVAGNEFAGLPFTPLHDGHDGFYARLAPPWGMVWTPRQWRDFRAFLEHGAAEPVTAELPAAVDEWPDSSWRKHYTRYLVTSGRWVLYPRQALAVQFGEGEVGPAALRPFRAPLHYGPLGQRLARPGASLARYDAYLEPDPATLRQIDRSLAGLEFDCDFYGLKPPRTEDGRLRFSIRPTPSPWRSYGFRLLPPELNLVHDTPGNLLSLAPAGSFGEVTPLIRAQLLRAWLPCDVAPLELAASALVRASRSYRLGALLLRRVGVREAG